jgi:UDP-N-acetylmuramate--alanine ligase
MDISSLKKVHFIGIGGIGVSAVARMMLHDGKEVTGSDRSDSEIITALKDAGARIGIGHDAAHIEAGTDLVVYTVAIPKDNPELLKAQELEITLLTYPQFVGEISKGTFTIAVSGTHGKTTTTAMIAQIMIDAGLDPTVIVGSLLVGSKTNFIAGKSKYLLIEACEFERSFLNYHPNILVITNIDNDHLDYYKDLADIQSAFKELAERIPEGGFIITDKNNLTVAPVLQKVEAQISNYTLYSGTPFNLKVPGIHNRKNAAAAFAVAVALGIPTDKALASLEAFRGTWRRFEYKGEITTGALLYDDYGHHPTEVKATLQGVRELYPRERLIVVFQPHLYSRTKLLLNDFVSAFTGADEVILAPIYAAREAADPEISSELLSEKIAAQNIFTKALPDFVAISTYLRKNTKKGDVVITMGAGDIYKVGEEVVK